MFFLALICIDIDSSRFGFAIAAPVMAISEDSGTVDSFSFDLGMV